MSDDQQQENGNSEVPEIELIIKVSPRLFSLMSFNICIINHDSHFL